MSDTVSLPMPRPSARPSLFKELAPIVLGELLRTFALIAAMLLAVGVLVQLVFQPAAGGGGFFDRLWDFVVHCHLNRLGQPLWPVFAGAARHTLPMLALAVLFLGVLSGLLAMMLAAWPRFQFLKLIVLAASAVPSFLWPVVPYLWIPNREFQGFSEDISPAWLALMLAVGDLNLITLTTVALETLRRDLAHPSRRLVETLGRQPVLDLWPQTLVTVLGALGSRIPHLIGGTIALELLYNIRGLGVFARDAIFSVPPDYHVILWVCGLGVIVSRSFRVVDRMLVATLLPHRGRDSSETGAEPSSDDGSPTEFGVGQPLRDGAETRRSTEPDPIAVAGPTLHVAQLDRQPPPSPGWCSPDLVAGRFWYYVSANRANWVKVLAAFVIVVSCMGVFVWGAMRLHQLGFPPPVDEAFLLPSLQHPLGTDFTGSDVLGLLGRGARQQAPALVLALGIACTCAVVAGVLGIVADLLGRGLRATLLHGAAVLADALAEFAESLSKLVVLLAAATFFDSDNLVLKVYAVIGLLFVPQFLRAIRDDLQPLRRAAFLETIRTLRVPTGDVLWHNVVRNHLLPTVLVQSALVLGAIVHVDALLGFIGVRNRSEIFTWGSVLGLETETYIAYLPLAGDVPFNAWSQAGPFVAVWLSVLTLYVLADGLKILLGNYVYRRA